MIKIFETKPCSDNIDLIQAEGVMQFDNLSLPYIENILHLLCYKVYCIGNPAVLIGKRIDNLIIIKSDGTFNITNMKSAEILHIIVQELTHKIYKDNG